MTDLTIGLLIGSLVGAPILTAIILFFLNKKAEKEADKALEEIKEMLGGGFGNEPIQTIELAGDEAIEFLEGLSDNGDPEIVSMLKELKDEKKKEQRSKFSVIDGENNGNNTTK